MSGSCRRSGAEPSGRDRQQPEAADDAPAGSRVRTFALTLGCGSTLAIVVIAVGSAVLAFIDIGPAPFTLTDTDATGCSVSVGERGLARLALKDEQLVMEGKDLDVFVPVAHRQ
jgi:hypothetical protein